MHPLTEPWAISEEGLQLVLAVYSKGEHFRDTLSRARAAHGDKPLSNDVGKMAIEGGVAVIPVSGPMFRHAELFSDISGATSYARIRNDLKAALAHDDVRAILLRIDSPGGEAKGVGELAEQIRAGHAQKPITAYVEGYGTSAAYWLASATGEIVAAPTAVLGSIGVRGAVIDDSGAQEKLGVREIEIISSQSPGKRSSPVNDEVLARAQARIDELASLFIADVAKLRGVSTKTVRSDFGGGDVLIGAKAVNAGLADRLGSFDSLLAEMRGRLTSSAATARTDQGASSMQTEKPEELVTKAELTAAQAKIAELQSQLSAQAPVMAAVAKLTGKQDAPDQVAELLSLADRVAQLPTTEQMHQQERARILSDLQQKNVSPDRISALEAAADAASDGETQLKVLRAGAAKLQGPRAFMPAGQERVSDPPEFAASMSDDEFKVYQAAGAKTREEALAMKREGQALQKGQPRREEVR